MTHLGTFKHAPDPNVGKPEKDHVVWEDQNTCAPPKAARDALEAAHAAGNPHAELRHNSNTLEWTMHDGADSGPRPGQGEGISPSGAKGSTVSELDAFSEKVAEKVMKKMKELGSP